MDVLGTNVAFLYLTKLTVVLLCLGSDVRYHCGLLAGHANDCRIQNIETNLLLRI